MKANTVLEKNNKRGSAIKPFSENTLILKNNSCSLEYQQIKNIRISYFNSIFNEETQTIVIRKETNKIGERYNERKSI